MASTAAPPGNSSDSDLTYLALRLGTVVVTFLLGTAVVLQIWKSGWCIKGSLSSYYYTPAGPVFVGVLCAIGACLIMYRGSSDAENVCLDFSGFLAFLVALLPTEPHQSCPFDVAPPPQDVDWPLRVGALFITGAVAIAVGFVLWKREATRKGLTTQRMSKETRVSFWASSISLLGLLAYFWLEPQHAAANGHNISAFVLFGGIVVAVLINAYGVARGTGTTGKLRIFWRSLGNRYGIIFLLMAAAAIATLLVMNFVLHTKTHVFWAETSLILLFSAFWIAQTFELKTEPARQQSDETALSGAN